MATEVIVTGKKYRILVDQFNRIWHRISFWTVSTDVWFDDGRNSEDKIKYEITKLRNELMKYLTADNGQIFQFGSKYDDDGELLYGHWIDGEFKPFGGSKYGNFSPPNFTCEDNCEDGSGSTSVTVYCNTKCKISGRLGINTPAGSGEGSNARIKIEDKTTGATVAEISGSSQTRNITITFQKKHTYYFDASASGYGGGGRASSYVSWDKPPWA